MGKLKFSTFTFILVILISLFGFCYQVAEKSCPDSCECTKLKNLKCKLEGKMSFLDLSNFDSSSVLSLDLSGNQISFVDNDIFINMTNLKKLDLSNNSLKQIDEDTFTEYLDSLEYLKLNQNNITHVFQGSFDKLKSLKQIDLTSNPLACDCDLMWIQNISIKLKPMPKCATPVIFKNSNVKKLKIGTDLHCTKALDPILELKPEVNQLIFEGDSLTLRCRAPRISISSMKDDWPANGDKVYWGWSETIPEENSVQDIFYHNPQLKFPSVLIDSKQSDSGILDTTLRIPYITRNHSGNWDCRLVSQQANLSRSVSVLVISDKTKYCPADETSDNKGDYSWPKTIVQKMVVLPCVSEVSSNINIATRKCNELGIWEKVDTSRCPYLSESTRILEQYAKLNFSVARGTILESAHRLKNYTALEDLDNTKKFKDPMDVVYIGKTIHNYLEFIREEKLLSPLILDIVSQVMDFPRKLLERAQQIDMTCRKLIEAAEIAASATISPNSQKNNMAIEIFKINSENFIEIFCSWYVNVDQSKSRTFQCNTAGKSQMLPFHEKNIEASIQFPSTQVITPHIQQRLLVSVFKNNNFFPQNRTFNNYRVTSNIIGVKLLAADGVTKLNVKNLSDPIYIVLKAIPFHHDLSLPKPVFLDPDSGGDWTLEGCRSSHFLRGMLVFSCNRVGYYGLVQHTSFLNDFPEDENAGARFKLSPPGFYIGSIILFIFMWIIIITYIVFFHAIQMGRRIKHALINTFFSIAMLTFVFCVGIYQTENYKVCQIFGLLIHYFSLCVLFWICVSVSNMYKKVSRWHDRISMESDLPREEMRVKKPIMGMYLAGYGISCIICGINSAINLRDYASYHYCFGPQALSAFYVPGSVLLFFLVIMFICIRFHLRTRSVTTYMSEGTTENGDIDLLEVNNDPGVARSVRSVTITTSSNVEDVAHSPREQLFAFILVLVIYILNWTLAFAAVTQPFKGRMVYEVEICTIAFALSASFLGGYILFFYGLARSDVRNIWMNLRCYYIQPVEENFPKDNDAHVVSGSVFYHRPLSTMSRSSSVISKQHRKSVEIQYLKSASELNSNIDSSKMSQNGGNFLLLHRNQNSVYGGDSSVAEVFYNQNQINVARRFFKKQKRLQKLNNIDVRRNDNSNPSTSAATNQLSYTKPAVNDMFGSGSKVNNTNIHVDHNNDCKTKYSNPNILSDSCNESELFMDIHHERLRFSTLKSKINNTDALQFANIYTNVPETQQPIHEIVTMRAGEKFNQEVINNLNSPVEKNSNPPLYVNARNIMDESEEVEEIYATKENVIIEEPSNESENDDSLLRINSPIEAMNTVGLPPTEPVKTEEEKLQLKPEEEYISAPLEISNRSFKEECVPEMDQKFDLKSKSKSMDNLDMNKSGGPQETHVRSISFNDLTAVDHDMMIALAPASSSKDDYLPHHMTSSLMMNRESQSPILISPSMCDIADDEVYNRSMIDDDDNESNYTVSNDTINESQDDLLNRTSTNSKLECTPIFLNPDNTPNFSIFNASNLYDSAPSPTSFSEINYQNSELSIRSQDLYAPQLDNDLNVIMAERDNFNFNLSDDEDGAENDDTFNDSRDFLIQPQSEVGLEKFDQGDDITNENANLLKDSQSSIDELYEQIKRKATMRPPIAPKPANVKLNRHYIFKNGDNDGKT